MNGTRGIEWSCSALTGRRRIGETRLPGASPQVITWPGFQPSVRGAKAIMHWQVGLTLAGLDEDSAMVREHTYKAAFTGGSR